MLLSEIIKSNDLDIKCDLISEKRFDCFARTKIIVNKRKCVFIKDAKYINQIDDEVKMVITNKETADSINSDNYGLCIVDSPRDVFFELLSVLDKRSQKTFETVIGKNCTIAKTAVVNPHNVVIGDNVQIGEYSVISANVSIGNNTTILDHCVIGMQDFNIYNFNGINKQIYHSGMVEIGSNVLIGTGTKIGQALYSYGKTTIGSNTCLAAEVLIGHNATIGENVMICARSDVGGFTSVGSGTELFMGVITKNGLVIGENAVIGMGSMVIRDIPDGTSWFGNPAKRLITPK